MDLGDWECWLGFLDGELHWAVVRWLSCSPYQFCNSSWFEYLRLGTFGTPCVLLILSLPPPSIQWDTPRRPLWFIAVYCHVYAVSDALSKTSVDYNTGLASTTNNEPQTKVARHPRIPVSIVHSPRSIPFQSLYLQTTDLTQKSSPEGSLVHVPD